MQPNVNVNIYFNNLFYSFPAPEECDRLNLLKDQCQTTLKISDCNCCWIGNTSQFAMDFKRFLNDLNQLESSQAQPSEIRLGEIQKATGVIEEGSKFFNQYQVFRNKLKDALKGLIGSQQPYSESVSLQIDQLNEMIAEIEKHLTLPSYLTSENVKEYSTKINHHLPLLKQRVSTILSNAILESVEVIQRQSYCIITGKNEQETLQLALIQTGERLDEIMEIIEGAKYKLEKHPELFAQIPVHACVSKQRKEINNLPNQPYNVEDVTNFCHQTAELCDVYQEKIEGLYASLKEKLLAKFEEDKQKRILEEKAYREKALAEAKAQEEAFKEQASKETAQEEKVPGEKTAEVKVESEIETTLK